MRAFAIRVSSLTLLTLGVAVGVAPSTVYAFNKQNPRWETEGHGPTHQFHKPYKPLHQPPGALPLRRAGRRPSMVLSQRVLLTLAGLIVLSLAAEWCAWFLRVPSAILLLLSGFVVGMGTSWVDPDVLFGDLLLPMVSLVLALMLFQQSLAVRTAKRRELGSLVGVGVLATCFIGAAAAHFIAGLDAQLATLFGALLVMTGPPLMVPLLRTPAWADARLERGAPVVEVIGAALVVLVFEALLAGGDRQTATPALLAILSTTAISIAAGGLGASVCIVALRWRWIPEFLQRPVCLVLAIGVCAVSHAFREASGFLAVIVMGIALANQRSASIERIRAPAEQGATLLGSVVMVVLAARLRAADVGLHDGMTVGLLALAVIAARLIATTLATVSLELSWRQRVRLACVAPPGIVAAALGSVVALRLEEMHYAQAELFLLSSFVVLAATVALSGLAASSLTRWIGATDVSRGWPRVGN